MKEGEYLNKYIAHVLVIANKMRANGEDLEDAAIVEKIQWSMTFKFKFN